MQIIENIIKENIDKHVRAEKEERSDEEESEGVEF